MFGKIQTGCFYIWAWPQANEHFQDKSDHGRRNRRENMLQSKECQSDGRLRAASHWSITETLAVGTSTRQSHLSLWADEEFAYRNLKFRSFLTRIFQKT